MDRKGLAAKLCRTRIKTLDLSCWEESGGEVTGIRAGTKSTFLELERRTLDSDVQQQVCSVLQIEFFLLNKDNASFVAE